ncbi:MAG: NUDIX hydrolase [Caldisphaera sp.]|jgi:ADP-ribose pyrophosphatase YjhB (NUDIX family)|nr:NUDIX hydrolase [Caldisphaera sp.]PMP91342.1 MAG: NUDIX hydrolase [Caldisphaera sp.]
MTISKFPKNPVVGIGTLLMRDSDVLLIKRANEPEKGMWAIPGGHLELGERILDAAKREFYEETGIDTSPLGVINVDEIITKKTGNSILFHYVLITVLMKDNGNEPKAGSDALEAKFFNINDIIQRDNISVSTKGLIYKIINNKVNLSNPIPVNTTSPI